MTPLPVDPRRLPVSGTGMATPAEAIARLDSLARELDDMSGTLAQVERALEPVQCEYEDFIAAFEVGLYERSVSEDGFKLPAEALRVKLAQRAMPTELYGKYRALTHSRERIVKRLGHLKTGVDAQRSILSALKAEAEASR